MHGLVGLKFYHFSKDWMVAAQDGFVSGNEVIVEVGDALDCILYFRVTAFNHFAQKRVGQQAATEHEFSNSWPT